MNLFNKKLPTEEKNPKFKNVKSEELEELSEEELSMITANMSPEEWEGFLEERKKVEEEQKMKLSK